MFNTAAGEHPVWNGVGGSLQPPVAGSWALGVLGPLAGERSTMVTQCSTAQELENPAVESQGSEQCHQGSGSYFLENNFSVPDNLVIICSFHLVLVLQSKLWTCPRPCYLSSFAGTMSCWLWLVTHPTPPSALPLSGVTALSFGTAQCQQHHQFLLHL